MSGICGICEPQRSLNERAIGPMLEALVSAEESTQVISAGRSVVFGVAQRWGFQSAISYQGVSVTADADFLDMAGIAGLLSIPTSDACLMSTAELTSRLYLKYGIDFVKHLQGGFSLALWDEKAQRLVLAIDRMGIKTLYWRRDGNRCLFASRLRAVSAVQIGSPEVHAPAVLQFLLFSNVPAPMSIDRGTERLRPGTLVVFDSGTTVEKQYWDLEYPESEDLNEAFWTEKLRAEMRGAVHRHLENCEPDSTGCYLSGGTDSSSVVAFASEKQKPAQSFTIAFQEAGFSEIEFARTAAASFHTKHHEMFLTPSDAFEALTKIIDYYDEPFANSSAIGSYYCALLARQNGVHTLLAGDGGDELFGGNERYATDKRFAMYHVLPAWLRHGLIEPLTKLLPDGESKLSLPKRYVRRANIPNPRRILSYGFFLSTPPEEVFEPSFLEQAGASNLLAIPEAHFARAKATTELNRLLYLDLKMTLADNDLRKVSGTAELAGVNVRYPLLDYRLAELSGHIPTQFKLKGFEKRYIFKKAMKGILPEKILYKKKHGFGVPIAQWLLQDARMRELTQDVIHDSRTRQRGYFLPGFFDRLMALHGKEPNFYGEIVWYLLAFELWHRRHAERSRETAHAI